MSLAELMRDSVLAAVLEFDQLGRDEFLRHHRFDQARDYLLGMLANDGN